jgi:hypothetical protein
LGWGRGLRRLGQLAPQGLGTVLVAGVGRVVVWVLSGVVSVVFRLGGCLIAWVWASGQGVVVSWFRGLFGGPLLVGGAGCVCSGSPRPQVWSRSWWLAWGPPASGSWRRRERDPPPGAPPRRTGLGSRARASSSPGFGASSWARVGLGARAASSRAARPPRSGRGLGGWRRARHRLRPGRRSGRRPPSGVSSRRTGSGGGHRLRRFLLPGPRRGPAVGWGRGPRLLGQPAPPGPGVALVAGAGLAWG